MFLYYTLVLMTNVPKDLKILKFKKYKYSIHIKNV